MKYRTLILIFAILLIPKISIANDSKTFETSDASCGGECYRSITFLSQGETILNNNDKKSLADIETGLAYRIVVTTSEIYNEVYIESISIGSEGCCKEIISTTSLPLEKIYRSYGFMGEISRFVFIKWITPTSFEFKIYDRVFILSEINKNQIKIKEKIS